MKRYIVMPGSIVSKTDGGRHFISAKVLMHLYKVDPQECYIVDENKPETMCGLAQNRDFICLRPDYTGKYELPSPDIRKAVMVKRITEDGLFELKDHLKIGIEYKVDMSTVKMVEGANKPQLKLWKREIISTTDGQWLPTELLKIEGFNDGKDKKDSIPSRT